MVSTEKELLKSMQNIYKSDKIPSIINLLSSMKKKSEFEVSINKSQGLSILQYMDLAKYLITRAESNKDSLSMETTLDIGYNYDSSNLNNYRITINGLDKINRVMSNLSIRKNHSIFSILVNNIINSTTEDKDIVIINKQKSLTSIVDLNDYDLRFRLASENDIDKDTITKLINLSETERNKISFRFKHRLSLLINGSTDFNIRIDLTDVKQNMSINRLDDSKSNYELEIEVIRKNSEKGFNGESALNKLLLEVYRVHQILQKSNKIVSITTKNDVLSKMKLLMYGSADNDNKDLPAMQTQSLENQHVASELSTQYSVTDKADGERNFLIIMNGRIFLISNNLDVKEIDNSHYGKLDAYNDTIIDGEYYYVSDHNKFLFLAFDILCYKKNDMRDEVKLEERLNKLNDVLTNAFGVKNTIEKYRENANLSDIVSNYKKQIFTSFAEINSKLKKDPHVIMGKLFFIPLGVHNSELYAYSEMIWNLYTEDKNLNCPYVLDGLIYTPLNQKYTRNLREIKYKIYKWKPSSKNSIDFYIKFERSPDTRQIVNVYDNSSTRDIDDSIAEHNLENEAGSLDELTQYKLGNKVYRICNLYVGSTKTGNEQPVLFGKEDNLYLAYLYLQDGEARDIEGNIIQDGTVVEFSYNNDPLLEHPYRWIPLRTRFDKTESVVKYQRKYGNNEFIADKVWRSIITPFDFVDITQLANEATFESHMEVIKSKVTKEIIAEEKKADIYYQIQTNLANPMRDFHNFLKSNLIYVICAKKSLPNGQRRAMDVLDVGIGRGGDLLKYYHSRVNTLTGFDPDANNLYSATDGVLSRYQAFKRKMPNFPKSTFLIVDAGLLFDMSNQDRGINNMSDINKQTIKQVFGETEKDTKHNTFDIFSCQFMLHYLFKNDQTLDNFCANINKYLNKDGYVIITTINGAKLNSKFVDGHYTEYYTDNGKKKILFDFKKLYEETNLNKTGLALDFHNASYMLEGTYQTEYLVDPDFLIETLETKCNLVLTDMDSFENQFNMFKRFFDEVAPYEANEKTKNYFMKVKKFYDFDDEVNKNSYELSRLNNYYVFQKVN